MLLERTTYAVYCRDFRSIKCAGIAGGLAAIEHKCQISDPSGGAADHQHHLRYTISQASPALRWIAWRSSDPGGPRGGPKRFLRHIWPDTPSLRELVASTAPPGSQDPRSWITLRFGSRLLMDEPGCPPAFCSKGLPRRLLRTSL